MKIDGEVINPVYLRRYWKEWRRRDNIIRRGMNLDNLEQVSPPVDTPDAEAPWANDQWQYVQQLRAQVNFLQNKINKHLDKRKSGGKY